MASQIQCHMINNNIFLQLLQSAYCSHHSTETALLKVTNNLLMNMEKSRVSLFLLLDLSAAFDTADHGICVPGLEGCPILSTGIQSYPHAFHWKTGV